ncbi:hypothetical protein C8R45DRAFT_979164 [Mycena sanguinolenta]|nr:hypothetical protein C8R45DRAFT_979164 [Mycena sanguinolenta]
MIETHGSLELVTKLWALDVSASNESIFGPFSTETLGTLIKYAHIVGKPDIHKRVIEAAGGEVDFIVQLALGRVKEATKTIDPDRGALALSWHIVLIAQLCRPHPHPLRRAFFDKDVIAIVTRSFAALSRIITQNPTPGCESMMVSSFNFFRHYLEGDDYLSLVHAIKAGFLPAFVDCSPTFLQLEEEEGDKVLDLMVNVLPRYLVYQSFIEAVTMEMEKLKTPHYQKLLSHPRINAPWRSFVGLLDKRRAPFNHIYSQGTPICCNYTKCQRVDVKRNFKKCGACESVVYCSPECQKLAWKACHRVMCKEMKAERAGNREKGRPKNDNSALQGLCQWVADVNSATFHAIAEKDFPDTPHEKLMPCIDFRHVPEKFSVKEIKQEVFAHPGVVFSPADAALSETRFQVEVSQWLAIPGTTIVQGIFAGGTIVEIVTAVMSKKNFWTNENKCNSDDSSDGR